jgi:hypothetical protein
MSKGNKDEVVYLTLPTFDDVLLHLLRICVNKTEWTYEAIERLERGESLWLTLF